MPRRGTRLVTNDMGKTLRVPKVRYKTVSKAEAMIE